MLDEDNDIDTIGKCANCGVEFHIHKELEMTKDECFTKLQLDIPPLESFDFKSMRKQKGLTLRQVEDLTRISNPYLSQLETGKVKSPSYSVVRTLIMLYSTTK